MENKRCKQYRCVATSIEGLVQQIAVTYLRHGYFYYVTGTLKTQQTPEVVDEAILSKYNIRKCWRYRAEQKMGELANMQYLRCGRFYVLMATEGEHPFKQRERKQLRDIRDPKTPLLVPITADLPQHAKKKGNYRDVLRTFEGYQIAYKRGRYQRKTTVERAEYRQALECWRRNRIAGKTIPKPPKGKEKLMWHATVSIERHSFERLRSYFLTYATRWKREKLELEFRSVPYDPYWMVKRQLYAIACEVNERRKGAGMEPLPPSVVHRMKRSQVFPFRPSADATHEVA